MRLRMLLSIVLLAPSSRAIADAALDRWSIAIGAFDNTFHIKGRVDGSVDNEGTLIDFGERFGLDNRRSIDLYEATWRFAEHHQLELREYADERTREARLDDTIEFDGERFPAQLQLRGSAGFSVTELTYAYWWHPDSHLPWALQLGVMRLRGSLGLRGRIEVDGVGEAEGSARVSEHVDAPVIGVAFRHALNPHWRWFGETRLIRLSLGALDGHAFSTRVGVEWLPSDHLGIALQYGASAWKAERERGGFRGELEIGFRGPQLLIRLRG